MLKDLILYVYLRLSCDHFIFYSQYFLFFLLPFSYARHVIKTKSVWLESQSFIGWCAIYSPVFSLRGKVKFHDRVAYEFKSSLLTFKFFNFLHTVDFYNFKSLPYRGSVSCHYVGTFCPYKLLITESYSENHYRTANRTVIIH